MPNVFRKGRALPWIIAAAVLAAVVLAVWFRAKSPPEAARLLPESDAVLYAHVKTLRTFTHFDTAPVHRTPDYQAFIDATGFNPERDLDAVALAFHRLPDSNGPNGGIGYSEVFVGRFDGPRLQHYLGRIANAQETYAGRTIFCVPVEGRTLRVTQLGYDTIAASNMPTAEQIHSMLDRSHASALGSPGSSLMAARFGEVPLLSAVWGIGHLGLPFAQHGRVTVLGLELPVPEDADLVASVRYHGSVQLRIEEFAPDALDAQHTVDTLTPLLGILRGLADAQGPRTPADAAMRDALGSATLEAKGSHALLTASVGLESLKGLLTAPTPVEPAVPPVPQGPVQTPQAAASPH